MCPLKGAGHSEIIVSRLNDDNKDTVSQVPLKNKHRIALSNTGCQMKCVARQDVA